MNGFRELKSDYSREREKWSTVHGKIIVCQPSDVLYPCPRDFNC